MLHLHVVLEVVSILKHFLALWALLLSLWGTAHPKNLHLISDGAEPFWTEWTALLIESHFLLCKDREDFLVQSVEDVC